MKTEADRKGNVVYLRLIHGDQHLEGFFPPDKIAALVDFFLKGGGNNEPVRAAPVPTPNPPATLGRW